MSFQKAVNQTKVIDYQEHLNSDQIFDLRSTAASLYTLAEEYRSSIESRNTSKVRKFIENVFTKIEEWWDFETEQEKQNLKQCLLSGYMESFGYSSSITPQDAQTMLKITETLSKVCERAHKINDSFVYKLEWGEHMKDRLESFLEEVVLPEIPAQSRINIAMKAKKFFSTTKKEILALPAPKDI
jgi:hypothetical protein